MATPTSITYAAAALLLTGCSGTKAGSPGTNELSGAYAFPVRTVAEVDYTFPDGGLDPNEVEVLMTDDGTDSCQSQAKGYPDGGYPVSQFLLILAYDPTGVRPDIAYRSWTAAEDNNNQADAGGPGPSAATAWAEVLGQTSSLEDYGVGGTVTFARDPTTELLNADFSLTMEADEANGVGGSASTLSGNGTPSATCVVELPEY